MMNGEGDEETVNSREREEGEQRPTADDRGGTEGAAGPVS